MILYEKFCKKVGEVWYNFVKKEGNLLKIFIFLSCFEVGCLLLFFFVNIIFELFVIFIFGFIEYIVRIIILMG